MTVEYKDGNRITALSTDLLPTNPQDGMVVEFTDTGAIGFRHNNQWQIPSAWEFLGSKKLAVAGDNLDVALSDDKIREQYQILSFNIGSGVTNNLWRFNNDTTGNYSESESADGVADTPRTGSTAIQSGTITNNTNRFIIFDVSNIINQEKLVSYHHIDQDTAGSSTSPHRKEFGAKYDQSPLIKTFSTTNSGGGSYNIDSELLVIGQSPNVTVPENRRFWKQIAFSEVRGTADRLVASWEGDYDYVWAIAYSNSLTSTNLRFQLNGDEGSNYNNRRQTDGTETTSGSQGVIDFGTGSAVEKQFVSCVFVNKPTEEKLGIAELINNNGNGSDLVPNRKESAWKHAQTTNRTKQIDMTGDGSSNDMAEGSFIIVYGGNALW